MIQEQEQDVGSGDEVHQEAAKTFGNGWTGSGDDKEYRQTAGGGKKNIYNIFTSVVESAYPACIEYVPHELWQRRPEIHETSPMNRKGEGMQKSTITAPWVQEGSLCTAASGPDSRRRSETRRGRERPPRRRGETASSVAYWRANENDECLLQ
jgi:hypothetical protein